jgi:phosphoribosylformylglycinamidine synthase I
MKTAVIVFPGSNCDRDMAVALEQVTGRAPAMIWHRETELPEGIDFIALPGGFSYGDYLRSGAMAARSPILRSVADAAARGVPVLGVCNGFQVLTEAQLLPGALMRNAGLNFVCRTVPLTVENSQSLFTASYGAGETINIPVAHHDGNYFADAATLDRIEGRGARRVPLRRCGQRVGARHRGRAQRCGQCAWHDAAPRTRDRPRARRNRRATPVRGGARRPRLKHVPVRRRRDFWL